MGAAGALGAPLVVAARRGEAAAGLVALARSHGVEADVAEDGLDVAAAVRRAPAAAVVSTVPVDGARLVAAAGWAHGTPLLDVLYAPRPTPLEAVARRAGADVVDGSVVLVGQAVAQVVRWAGADLVDATGGRDALSARMEAALRPGGTADGPAGAARG